MRHEARVPDDSVNVSRTHPVREALVLVAGVSASFAALLGLAAVSVDLLVRFVPTSFERRAFAGWSPSPEAPDSPDDALRQRSQALLDRLAARWNDAPYAFRLGVVRDAEANAVALPGGHVLVTRGLLERAGSENELAFVLGHELGHFAHRDHLRRLGRAALFGLFVAPLLASGHAVPQLPGVAAEVASRGFDREQEAAADRFGLSLVQAEYGHVAGAADFFARLAEADPTLGVVAAYASTHPGSASRVGALEEEARRRGWRLEGPKRSLEPAAED